MSPKVGITLDSRGILARIHDFIGVFFAFLDSFLCFPLKQLAHQRCSLHAQTKTNPNPFNPDPFKLLHPHPQGIQLPNPLSDSPQPSPPLTVATLTQLLSGS